MEVMRIPYEIAKHRGKLNPAVRRFRESLEVFAGAVKDPYNSFDQIMNISERCGTKSIFYFMADQQKSTYAISDPEVKETIEKILTRGHEIGLHPNFGTYASYERLNEQKHQLDGILGYTGYGARQHYLQWKVPDTWRIYERAGILHDSSLGHTEMPGFRCGTCYPYPVFDIEKRQSLSLTEIPLILMDASVYSYQYESLRKSYFDKFFSDDSKSFNIIDFAFFLKRQVRSFGGCFSILWHNDRFDHNHLSDYLNLIQHSYPVT
jgi:hypothetical protein